MAKVSKNTPIYLTMHDNDSLHGAAESADPYDFLNAEPITHAPNVDMFTTPDEIVIEVEIPGVRKHDIELFLCKNVLTLKALKFECFEENKVNYVCMERVFGRFCRSIEIPSPVDTARVKAVYENGILTITAPRVEDKRSAKRRVPIESGK